jgi:hypothetical protein
VLKGSREAIFRHVESVSIHGQLSWDVYFSDPDDPDGPMHKARVDPEAVARGLEAGDRIRLEYLVGSVISVTRAET